MNKKIAIPTHLSAFQECSSCHCSTQDGYTLRGGSTARFVCEECYEQSRDEYPAADKTVKVNKAELEAVVPEGKKPGFHAGYLLGTRNNTDVGYSITAEKLVESTHSGNGAILFFNKDDVLHLHKLTRSTGKSIVGLFRTNPSGTPDFTPLDDTTIEDMLPDIVYMIIGGRNEMRIAVKDKHSDTDEIGVIIS